LHPIGIVSQEKQNPNSTVSVWLLRNAFRKKKCHSQPPAAWKGLAPPSQSAQNPRKRWSLEVEKKGKIPRNLTGSTRKADGLDVSLQFLEHNMFIPI
jgi:hypothetical protein